MLNLVLTGALGNNHRQVIDEAKKTSLPEVLGDAGITLNPCDEQSFCESLLSIYKSPIVRTELSAKAIVQKFSHGRTFPQNPSVRINVC